MARNNIDSIDTTALGYIREGLDELTPLIDAARQRVQSATSILDDAQSSLDAYLEKKANLIAAARALGGSA